MKNIKMIVVMMAMVMVVMVGCKKDLPYDKVTISETAVPQLPTDAVLKWYGCGDKDSVIVRYTSEATHESGSYKVPAPVFVAGNCYIKQGTQPLEDLTEGPVAVADTTGNVVWSYNYSINDAVRVNLGIPTCVIRYNPMTGQLTNSNEVIYPGEAMGIFETIEKTYPEEATGYFEINVMRYTLAPISSPALYAGKTASKATIFEIPSDTTIVHDTTVIVDTVVVHDSIPVPPTPDPQITDVTASCSHNTWGNWYVTGNGIKIDGTNTVTETTYYDNGTSAVTGNDTYNCSSLYTFTTRPLVYDHAIDGTYPVIGNTVADLGLAMVHSHSHDNPIMVNGHNYSNLAPDCDLEIYQVTVVGNTVTLNGRGLVNGEYVYRNYSYTVTINIPTPTTDTTVFGNIVYWSLTGTANAYSWTAVQWYINIITNDADGYHHRAALYTEGMSVSQLVWHDYGVMTTAEYNHVVSVSNFNTTNADGSSNAAQGVRRGLAVCKNSTAGANPGVSSTVKSDPNGGNNQVKYYSKTGSLIGACSAVTGTIDGNNGGEPVRAGGVENHFPMGSQNVY